MKCIESVCVYGPSGAGKTTQAEELAKLISERFGPKAYLRLISASGGGWSSVQPAVDVQLIEPLFVPSRKNPFALMHKLSQGWWPANVEDPASELVSPEKQGAAYENCKGLFFDSITEICDWMMRDSLLREAAKEFKISGETASNIFKDGDTSFASAGRGHYGTIQNYISQFVAQSKAIGGKYIVWTALELKAADDITKMPLYGPDIIGKAQTAKSGAWFDDLLHLHLTQGKQGPIRTMYTSTHFETDGVPYMAKNRGHRAKPLPLSLTGDKLSLMEFLKLLEESYQEAKTKLQQQYKTKEN
jgi:energy-coupling factor transporter ATP-binding protein EcfA2